MAQVVRQRSTSTPYLLVIVSALLVFALGGNVFYYLQFDKKRKEVADYPRKITHLEDQLKESKQETQGIIYYLDEDETSESLIPLIKNKKEEIYEWDQNVSSMELLPMIDQLFSRVKTAEQKLLEAKQDKKSFVEKFEGERDAWNLTKASMEKTIASQIAVAAAHEKKLLEREAVLKQETADVVARNTVIIAQKDAAIKTLKDEKTKNKIDKGKSEARIAFLTKKIEILEMKITEFENPRPSGDAGKFAGSTGRKMDGKILKILPDENICYINLGSADGVKPYTSFAIYELGSKMTDDGLGKGKLLVTSTSKNVSECKIIAQDNRSPARVNDSIANIAFDKVQTYTFVVSGTFDLTGGDDPTQQAREEIKALILRSGSKIAKEIGVETDFIVLGTQPQTPPKPGPAADLNTVEAYREALGRLQEFNNLLDRARTLGVRVLNTNSFVAFMGL